MQTFGSRLKHLRLEKNMTQEELGKLLGKSKNNISQYERDIRQADDETKKFLADFFAVSLDYLLGRTNNKNNINDKISIVDNKDLSKAINAILEEKGIVKPGEDLTDEQLEWLKGIVDKALDIAKPSDKKN